jgi:archaemetzincin
MSEPQEYDWLAAFNESGQTFDEYLNANPTLPSDERRTIYILPLGKFDRTQQKIVELTMDFMGRFFSLPMKLLPAQSLNEQLSKENYRIHPGWRARQIKTGYVLDEILRPQLPSDAAAMIAFTSEDLYPDETMYYVFGQASFENRVGVWSLYRLNYAADKHKDFNLFLSRTLKIAAHETGHMFSMAHCTKYECVMSGTNHLGETDRRPFDVCPECMAKISWGMNYEPQTRYERLAEFFRENNLKNESEFFLKEAKAVSNILAKEN